MVNNEVNSVEDTLRLGGRDIPVKRVNLKQSELLFCPENPRIYSVMNLEGRSPSQDEILEKMSQLDHVKRLYQSIQINGGLIDPLIVQEGTNLVFEGNSRLAAYRLLAEKDPIKWGYVKCCLLPKNIDEKHIATLLGEYHIIGRKDWSPYEQAGYLWRRHKKGQIPIEQIATELSLTIQKVRSAIEVFSYMVEHNDVSPQRWSYYDEFLKSRAIARAIAEEPNFEKTVVDQIQSGVITKAVDIRDKVEAVAKAGGKALKHYSNGKRDLEESYNIALAKGVKNHIYNRFKAFRSFISEDETRNELKQMEDEHLEKCLFEIRKISKEIERMIKTVS